jgi:uncharacterized SAM-binding protein YcdF (DUF218 family)
MFFLSKALPAFINPVNLLVYALIAGLILSRRSTRKNWQRRGRRLTTTAIAGILCLGVLPVGSLLTSILENRLPIPQKLPVSVDGIIALGGVVDAYESEKRGQFQIGSAIERITSLVELAQKYPEAKIVFTGGTGSTSFQEFKEADAVKKLMPLFRIDQDRVIYERDSRNTFENAKLSKELLKPQPEETWILVTSAFHMPRAVGVFRKQAWEVIPYPVDFETSTDSHFSLDLVGGLQEMSKASHEWLGLFVYWLTGRTSAPFPEP